MDFSGIPMDQDHNALLYDSSDKWTDHVKWQGSQTACPALNQLIKSSVNETAQEAPRLSGWQRVSSYDQLPGLHSTAHQGTATNSSLLSSHSRPSSSKPSSSSRPYSRARLSETRAPAPVVTNDLPIPLFNKTNPMEFLDIMKGVSARLDENAGVRSRKDPNASSSRAKKRARGVSLGGISQLQTGKTAREGVKKGRVDELRAPDTLTRDEGNGEGRTTSKDEDLDSEVRGRGLQTHSSLPDIPSRSDLKRSLSSKDVSFMDVDDKDDDMDADHASSSAVLSSSNRGYPETRSFARTCSQKEMPPPPIVHKQCHPDHPRQQSNVSSSSTPFAVSRHSNSIDKPQTSYPPARQPPLTNHPIKQRKPDPIPKLHPLLYHKPATTRDSSSSFAPQVQLRHHPAPIPMSEDPDLKAPPPSSFTPMFSSTPSSRPPPLGMRRNHTFPSRSTVQQESSSSLLSSDSQLPQRQKGFKPPLLSLSQPQTQTQTHGLSQVEANANVIVVESGNTTATSKKVSSRNLPEASSTNKHECNTTTNTSMTLRSSSSSSSSDSSSSFRSTPPNVSSASSSSHSHSLHSSSGYSSSKKSDQGMTQPSQVIPEPLDGDGDSSFGDMSFDWDALEETMKMYD